MDLINASNVKQIKAAGIGAREIKDIADVLDTDGPIANIAERFRYTIEQVKTARYLWGSIGRKMQTPEGKVTSSEQFILNTLKQKISKSSEILKKKLMMQPLQWCSSSNALRVQRTPKQSLRHSQWLVVLATWTTCTNTLSLS